MKSIRTLLICSLLPLSTPTIASGFAIGTDAIRFIDEGQFFGEAANGFIQIPLSSGNATVITIASDKDDNNMVEGAFKAYSGNYMQGVYYQAGGALYEFPGDDEISFHGAIGYEKSPADHFLYFGAVKATKILDYDTIDYTPMLGIMLTF